MATYLHKYQVHPDLSRANSLANMEEIITREYNRVHAANEAAARAVFDEQEQVRLARWRELNPPPEGADEDWQAWNRPRYAEPVGIEIKQDDYKAVDGQAVPNTELTCISPKDSTEMIRWGIAMDNCIGSYGAQAQRGDNLYLAFVDSAGTMVANAELGRSRYDFPDTPRQVIQLYGAPRNKRLESILYLAICRFLADAGLISQTDGSLQGGY